ncbi:MAG: asparaginase [Kordiimonadaceae bacterium]|jgi:L-asparaginase|nr:asparaginase [Kordiimonadaceae bacterium]MBT6032722.1 asparaginase [Kordiimonadaceae bacterium]
MSDKADIALYLLGGTISMAPKKEAHKEGETERPKGGVVPTISADDLCAVIPGLDQIATVRPQTFKKVASANLNMEDALRLKEEIEKLAKTQKCDGVVIVQGTDTLEEMAFLLDIILEVSIPVIVTGAMRSANMVSADGASNILSSVIAASFAPFAMAGVLVVMNEDIHAARYVQKCHTRDVGAFKSLNGGIIGQVCEGMIRMNYLPPQKRVFNFIEKRVVPKVGLVKATFGDEGDILKLITDENFQGLVIEAFGAGHLPESWLDHLDILIKDMPIMLCSRTSEGPVFQNTYGYVGAEIDLIGRGLIPSGILDGPKARLYMQACLMSGMAITPPDY